jgi:Rrf2 family protein
VLSSTSEYALRAAVWLAQAGGAPQTNQEIAAATQAPPGYLSKVLQALGRAGLVRASRGKHGGFELAKPAAELTILEIINAVDPIRRIHSCPLALKSHARQLCPLHRRIDQAVATIERSFSETTLAELLDEPDHPRPLCDLAELRSHA